MNIAILGGGISGTACAHRLSLHGHSVVLVEKGRGVGGRMSTRRMGGARIDHGAQFLTVRDERMNDYLLKWKQTDVVKAWYDRIPGREDLAVRTRYRGTLGMNSPVKSLAESLAVEKQFFVESIERKDQWLIRERAGLGRNLRADHVVVTFPVPQVLELFQRSGFSLDPQTMQKLRAVRYTRCLALLGLLEGSSALDNPGTLTHPIPEVDWISDNMTKGISGQPACTIHASSCYSEKFWDAPDEERIPLMIKVAEENLKARITQWSSHRWGFAKPLVTFGATHFHSLEDGISLAGDGFGGERIENAFLSGWKVAQSILSSVGQNLNR